MSGSVVDGPAPARTTTSVDDPPPRDATRTTPPFVASTTGARNVTVTPLAPSPPSSSSNDVPSADAGAIVPAALAGATHRIVDADAHAADVGPIVPKRHPRFGTSAKREPCMATTEPPSAGVDVGRTR